MLIFAVQKLIKKQTIMAKFIIEVEIEDGYTSCENCPFNGRNNGTCAGAYINCGVYDLNKMTLLSLDENDSNKLKKELK